MSINFKQLQTGKLGQVLEILHPKVESNRESLLIQLLACFGNCIGRGPYFNAAVDKHFTNLFIVIVGLSARGRKGMSLNLVKDLFSEVDPIWFRDHIKNGLSSGEGLISQIKDKDCADASELADKRLLCVEPEFSSVLKMTQREGNILSQILRDCWDSNSLQTLTKNDPLKATAPMISVIGHITDAELLRLLSSTEIANGLGNRYIYIRAKNDKKIPISDPFETEVKEFLVKVIKSSVELAKSVSKMNFTEEAGIYWKRLYYSFSDTDATIVGSLTARQEAQIRRLAMIIALFNEKNEIDLDSLMFAEKIFDYSVATLKEIYGYSMGDPLTDKIYELLKASPNALSRSEIQAGLRFNYQKGSIDRSLGQLKSQGLAEFKIIKTLGRPSEMWSILQKELSA